MGWCHEFGPQIREGCDHPMVAGRDACSCPECGVVCHGQSAACIAVWAAGPKEVSLRRPRRETVGPRVRSALSATNGNTAKSAEVALFHPPAEPPSAESQADLRPALNALRAEITVLNRKVDQLQQQASSTSDLAGAAETAIAAMDALPNRLRRAVGSAMQEHHGAILNSIGALNEQVAAQLSDASPSHAGAPSADLATVVREVDLRFAWLADQLSDRFVTLGNELARIDRLLSAMQSPR